MVASTEALFAVVVLIFSTSNNLNGSCNAIGNSDLTDVGTIYCAVRDGGEMRQ